MFTYFKIWAYRLFCQSKTQWYWGSKNTTVKERWAQLKSEPEISILSRQSDKKLQPARLSSTSCLSSVGNRCALKRHTHRQIQAHAHTYIELKKRKWHKNTFLGCGRFPIHRHNNITLGPYWCELIWRHNETGNRRDWSRGWYLLCGMYCTCACV